MEPEHGLLRQSWAPRRQRHGTINADGFGVGWYVPRVRPEPAVYRRATPMWSDVSFASLAGVVESGCVLAAVRDATPGMPVEESATAPFTGAGRVLLSHNGRVRREVVLALLAKEPEALAPESACDSAALAALVFTRLARGRDGAGPNAGGGLGTGGGLAGAVASVVVDAGDADPGARLNLLATDGASIVATAWADTLSYRRSGDGWEVASEPGDDDSAWSDVPDRHLLVADEQRGVTLRPLT